MSSKVRKIGRLRVIDKNGCRNNFEIYECDGVLSIAGYCRQCEENDRPAWKSNKLQLQDRPPVEEPPHEPQKPPVDEPEDPPEPPPPPNRPPVEEPPYAPDGPPVKEPPPKDPEREPPQKPPMKLLSDAYGLHVLDEPGSVCPRARYAFSQKETQAASNRSSRARDGSRRRYRHQAFDRLFIRGFITGRAGILHFDT